MVVRLKTASVRVSFIQIMQIRVKNKSKSVWKSRYVWDVSTGSTRLSCFGEWQKSVFWSDENQDLIPQMDRHHSLNQASPRTSNSEFVWRNSIRFLREGHWKRSHFMRPQPVVLPADSSAYNNPMQYALVGQHFLAPLQGSIAVCNYLPTCT